MHNVYMIVRSDRKLASILTECVLMRSSNLSRIPFEAFSADGANILFSSVAYFNIYSERGGGMADIITPLYLAHSVH